MDWHAGSSQRFLMNDLISRRGGFPSDDLNYMAAAAELIRRVQAGLAVSRGDQATTATRNADKA
jgi:hypothetical protein